MKRIENLTCPAFVTVNKKQQWAFETPNATLQGSSIEDLFCHIVDIYIDHLLNMNSDEQILSQIVVSKNKNPL